jgi:vacuolar-type H+-ATPase subunit D/Vma8
VDELAHIESQIKALWEKAQTAGNLIARLKEEKQVLQTRTEQLERENAKLRSEISVKEQHVQKTVAEAKSTAIISNGEKEQITAKVKELLARIDAYL